MAKGGVTQHMLAYLLEECKIGDIEMLLKMASCDETDVECDHCEWQRPANSKLADTDGREKVRHA